MSEEMSLSGVRESEAESRLSHPDNLCNRIVEFRQMGSSGRGVGTVDLPPALRTLVASAAQLDTQANVAAAFDVAPSTVGANVKREAENGNVPSKNEAVRDKALDTLASLFDTAITKDTLSGMKPREAVSAAKDLASIFERVSPKVDGGSSVQFIIFQPRIRTEEEYDTIDVTPQKDGKPHSRR